MTARVVFILTLLVLVLGLLLAAHRGRKAQIEVETVGSEVGLVVPGPALPPTTTTMPTTTTSRPAPVARTAPMRAASVSRPVVTDPGVWDRLASCESGGNWHINTGNGYYGGLQMDMQFWRSYGGPAFASRADLASREQQIVVAERARDSGRGYRPWPTCARRLGLI